MKRELWIADCEFRIADLSALPNLPDVRQATGKISDCAFVLSAFS